MRHSARLYVLLAAIALSACQTTTDGAGGATASKDAWRAAAPYALSGEVALLSRACVTRVRTGAETDLRPNGYAKQPRGFYYKGLHRDDTPTAIADGLIASSTINYGPNNSCRFGVGTLGGRGSELPFLAKVDSQVRQQLRDEGYRVIRYELRPGKQSEIFVKDGQGLSVFVSGTPGKAAASVAFSRPSAKLVERLLPNS